MRACSKFYFSALAQKSVNVGFERQFEAITEAWQVFGASLPVESEEGGPERRTSLWVCVCEKAAALS